MGECGLCLRAEESFLTGKLFADDSIAVHQNCLLFSSNLVNQNSQDFDVFGGFLLSDIKKEINRGSKLKCWLCGKKGATVGCEVKICKRSYHYPCANEDEAKIIENENMGIYRVYCKIHKDGKRPKSSGTSSSKIAHSRTDNGSVKGRSVNCLHGVSDLDKFQPKTSGSNRKRGAAVTKRVNSSDTDESDDLPIFTGTNIQHSAKSKTGLKQMKLENNDGKQKKLSCSSRSSQAEGMNRSSDERSPSLLATGCPGDGQEALLNESFDYTENSWVHPLLIGEENESNDGNCTDTSTNIDQEEIQQDIDDVQHEGQDSREGTSATIREPCEVSGQAEKFWKMCKEAHCLEKIFLTIQKDLNSIQQKIATENATSKDYEIAWAILLTMNSLQDIMSDFKSEIHQKLKHLEEEKLTLRKREGLIKNLTKLAHSLTTKAKR
ncbi:uncharacterized protein phf11 isoform X1 [Mobula hypostoma]|uniref:uncharacterized protein phf11 isoform X1 n=2 Tax=Mobula hypostoma TaxID=723540 RepID=UPI002FC3C4BC